ncbi:low molecular weight phosphotyrosine protein phosphatase [Actinobacteria bacterium YIM 96077]|uniref:protein-tyrosine-phosphatase n=1 Tax=Phytoactinopolyspora halophila TaxID=1981511 RepID=A0A329R4B2_9ACTN|nr:low molecular weight protein-tyrosine-phosphatase [Phytoactinopolyspora halophila]AYY11649.1 low molecular weight phosphotyrosine protein phosphatase [Actinobacteria bacterium YIM 96077]RAW17918.1 low molecular weight phosphotyrosine protein phosphatase [Phytoactinopolyspora halophila]
MKVCIVCAGNICRSPMAEVVFRSRLADVGLQDMVEIESAGTGAWHVGEPADPRAVDTLRAHGYEPGHHRARQFQKSWFDDVDLVLALDSANVTNLHRLAPNEEARAKIRMLRDVGSEGRDGGDAEVDVPDPYYGGDGGFELVLQLVEQAADDFLDAIRDTRDGQVRTPSRS